LWRRWVPPMPPRSHALAFISAMSSALEVPEYAVADEVRVDPTRAALVVVDMQNDFVRGGASLRVPDAESPIPAITTLLDLARAYGMRVGFTQDTHPDGDPERRIWSWHPR